MLKHCVIKGEINFEAVEVIAGFLNSLEPDEDARVYLCSDGGSTDARDVLLSMLNCYTQRLTLVAYCEICSAAFELFFLYEGRRELTFGTTGMYHRATRMIQMSSSGKPKNKEQDYLLADLKSHAATTAEHIYAITGMSKSDITKINQEHDVYFEFSEMMFFTAHAEEFRRKNRQKDDVQRT